MTKESPEPSWEELLRCALLGTDRYPLPEALQAMRSARPADTPASRLLRALAQYTHLQLGALSWQKVSDFETE